MSCAITLTEDGWAIKSAGRNSDINLHDVAAISRQLAEQGVQTPIMTVLHDNDLKYPWIRGFAIPELIEKHRHYQRVSGAELLRETAIEILRPVVKLHSAAIEEPALNDYDPFKRISPRIQAHCASSGCLEKLASDLYSDLMQQAVSCRPKSQVCVVHGDLHVGQLVKENDSGLFWLIDLDDIALGHPEMDCANFVAHFVTSHYCCRAPCVDEFNKCVSIIQESYEHLSNRKLESECIRLYGAVALMRRALKFYEQDKDSDRVGSTLTLSENILAGFLSKLPTRSNIPVGDTIGVLIKELDK